MPSTDDDIKPCVSARFCVYEYEQNISLASCSKISKSESGRVVRVLALPFGGSRFEPRSRQLVKAIGRISGPCKLFMIDGTKTGKSM